MNKLKELLDEGKLVELGIEISKIKQEIDNLRRKRKHSEANEIENKLNEFINKIFEEFKGKEIVPILASLRIAEDILNRLTKEKIYGMAYREWEYMDILNFEKLKDRGE